MILEESQLLFSTMRGLNAASLTTLKGNYIIKYSMWSGIVPFRAARVWPYIFHFHFYRDSSVDWYLSYKPCPSVAFLKNNVSVCCLKLYEQWYQPVVAHFVALVSSALLSSAA